MPLERNSLYVRHDVTFAMGESYREVEVLGPMAAVMIRGVGGVAPGTEETTKKKKSIC